MSILEADNLKKYFEPETSLLDTLFRRDRVQVQAVDGVSLRLNKNEVIGVIGESGCGKTTLLNTLMGLYTPTGGSIRYDGRDTSEFNRLDWKEFRSHVQIIFQDPFNSLDPKMPVRTTLMQPLKIHKLDNKDERIRETLRRVQLPPEKYLNRLPNQLSGGEKQRVSIARALVVEPDVILADEPVSMLDVSTQAALLNLLEELTDDLDVAMMYISHDLSTVSYICDTINVMYLGRIVEEAPTRDVINDPKHPYTQALIDSVPIPDPFHERERITLEGAVEDPIEVGEGCRFRDRCPERMEICEKTPIFAEIEEGRNVACHLYYDHEEWEAKQDEGTKQGSNPIDSTRHTGDGRDSASTGGTN